MSSMRETGVQSLGWEDPLKKEMATHFSIFAWKIPWMKEPGGLQSTVSQRVRHNWATNTQGVLYHLTLSGLPWWLSGKESPCQCRRHRLDPWVRKIPWRRKWQPIPVFLPRISHGQRRLAGYSPWDCKELDMTEQLTHVYSGNVFLTVFGLHSAYYFVIFLFFCQETWCEHNFALIYSSMIYF